jgi:hypothetical protein
LLFLLLYFFFLFSFRCVVVFVVFVVFDVGIDELLGTSDSVIRRMRIVSKKNPFDFYNNESLNSIVRHSRYPVVLLASRTSSWLFIPAFYLAFGNLESFFYVVW